MQIFKKRLSVHRTSRNLRSLWDEYALQITAEGREKESSRLLALSSFMESIFDVGQPVEPSSLENTLNVDDTAVVVTGLLNVARRASIQLISADSCKEDVDRATLSGALRKALMVAKVCLRKDSNRENLNQVPHIVSVILSILENVKSIDNKVLCLQIICAILQFEESKIEFCRLGGVKLLCKLSTVKDPHLDKQVIKTLSLYLAPSKNSKNHSQLIASQFMESHSSVQPLHEAEDWPPVPPSKASITVSDSGTETGFNTQSVSNQTRPHADIQSSASLAAKGVNMAVNVVNEILRLTPMATTNPPTDESYVDYSNQGEFTDDDLPSCFGGVNITLPMSWIIFENQRVEALKEKQIGVTNTLNSDFNRQAWDHVDSSEQCLSDEYVSSHAGGTAQDIVVMIIHFLSDRRDHFDLQGLISLLQCAVYLMQTTAYVRRLFSCKKGYSALKDLIVIVAKELSLQSFHFSLDEYHNDSPKSVEDANLTSVILSLIFCRHISLKFLEESVDISFENVVKQDLLVQDVDALGFVLPFIASGSCDLIDVGLDVVDTLTRVCPLSIISLKNNGVVSSLARLVLKLLRPKDHFLAINFDEKDSRKTRQFGIFRMASNILVRVAVVDSEKDAGVLAFFVYILLEFSFYEYQSQLFHLPVPIEFRNMSRRSMPPMKCANCESETAIYECTDSSCICDEMFYLCYDCDKVFHKSKLKRSHIRLPILSGGTFSALLELMGPTFKSVIDDEEDKCKGQYLSSTDPGEFHIKASCLILTLIHGIIGDRLVNGQLKELEILEGVSLIFRYTFMTLSRSDGNSSYMDLDLQESILVHAADSPLESSFSLGLLRQRGKHSMNCKSSSSGIDTDCVDPPEKYQFSAQRIFLSLCIQVVARFFIYDRVPFFDAADLASDEHSNYSGADSFVSVKCCTLSEMALRLQLVQSMAFDALLVASVVKCNDHFHMPLSDKQFSLWLLREMCSLCFDVDISSANRFMIWWGWLINCDVRRESQDGKRSSRKTRAKETRATQKRQQMWLSTLSSFKAATNDCSNLSLPPHEHCEVSSQIRLFILQEVRLMLGGDSWDPVVIANSAGVTSKLFRLKHSSDIVVYSSKNRIEEDYASDLFAETEKALYFRVPATRQIVQASMLSAGVLLGLIDIVFGDLGSESIVKYLVNKKRQSPTSDEGSGLNSECNEGDVERWWTGFNALRGLVSNYNPAKELFDEYFGVHNCGKLLFPLILKCDSNFTTHSIGLFLSQFLMELSVHGTVYGAERPFTCWTSVSTVHSSLNKGSIFDKLIEHALKKNIGVFSHSYFVNKRFCQKVISSMRPHVIFIHNTMLARKRFLGELSSRSDSNCLDSRGSFKGDKSFPSNHVGLLGVGDGEFILDDRSSTGGGSFSFQSASHMSLPGMSRVYSYSTLCTPPPSVTGDTARAIDDHGSLHCGRLSSGAQQPVSVHKGTGEESFENSGVYLPLLSALGWGLSHRQTMVLGIVYDTLLLRSDSTSMNHNNSLLMSLRKQSITQYLQSFLPVANAALNSQLEIAISPKCVLRSPQLVANLFSLCMSLTGNGVVQSSILQSLSHLIDGNPLNAELMHKANLTFNMCRLLFSKENCFPCSPLCHILSQTFSHKITPDVLNALIDYASTVSGQRMSDKPMHLIPTKGVSQPIDSKTTLDDVGCQILYLLGRAVDHPEMPLYAYFDQSCPFLSRILLPPVSQIPLRSVGMTIVAWIRLGNLCDAPNATLMQLSVDYPLRYDFSSESTEGKETISLASDESNASSTSVDIYFRRIHRTSFSRHPLGGSRYTESSMHIPADFASVASGTTSGVEELQRTYVQLCISFGQSRSCLAKNRECDDGETADNEDLGLDGEIVSSLVKHSAPDAVVDFEWHEMGDWHSISMTFSADGIACFVDGVEKRVLYWTALGYVDTDEAPLNIEYPLLNHHQVLQPVIGGIVHEHKAYIRSIKNLTTLWQKNKSNIDTCADMESKLRPEVDLLQMHSEAVRGMSGYLGGILLLEGKPSLASIKHCHDQGPQFRNMSQLFPASKAMASFTPALLEDSRSMPETTKGYMSSLGENVELATSTFRSDQRSRGRQNSNEDGNIRNFTRLSRSLSPNNSRYGSASQVTSILFTNNILDQLNLEPHRAHAMSLAGDYCDLNGILTIFNGTLKGKSPTLTSKQGVTVEGSVLIRIANNLADQLCSAAKGGLRIWYPLLIMDAPRQVATLRIIASLISSSNSVLSEFEAIDMMQVILYCLYVTPLVASEASLQSIFDLATQHHLQKVGVAASQTQSKNETIQRVGFLKLAMDIAASSPCNIQLAMCTVEWLVGLCDDSAENISKVLETLGMAPFLLILSLWLNCEDMQLIDFDESFEKNMTEYTIRMPCTNLDPDVREKTLMLSKGVFNDSIFTVHSKKFAKLQVTIARFLKLLITGSNGELPSIRVAASTQLPTGFGISHLQSLINFISHIVEFLSSGPPPLCNDDSMSSSSPTQNSNDFISSSTAANWTIFSDSHDTTPQNWCFHACQLALDCIIYPSEGPLGATIITMMRSALPGNELWYFLISLLRCSHATIKARSLHLLGLSLSSSDGQIDQRLVAQFDKIGGFRCIARLVTEFSGNSNTILNELLTLFFWRNGSRGAFAYTTCGSPADLKLPPNEHSELSASKEGAGTGSSIFSMFNWMTKPDKSEEIDEKPGKSTNAHVDIEDQSSLAENEMESHSFQSIVEATNDSNNSPPPIEQPIVVDKVSTPHVETIALPQLFESILKVLENEKSPERISSAISSIERALVFPPMAANDPSYEVLQTVISHNLEALTGDKSPDWLLWIYNCLVVFKRRHSQDDLCENNLFSMSEGCESGAESGDDTEYSRGQHPGRNHATPPSPIPRQFSSALLDRYIDPLLGLVQVIMRIDIIRKPSTSRKLYDILKLPLPEGQDHQLTILLDLLHSVNYHQQYNTDYDSCMNVLRNISAFLEKVLMKSEVSLIFCVKAVQTMDSLVYRAPPEVRSKVKDTLLPEVRNSYVTYCLVQRLDPFYNRISALAEVHSSVLNLIVSGEPRTIFDHQVFLLLLELLIQATTMQIDSEDNALDISGYKLEESQVLFEMQTAVVILIQNCLQGSADCRRCAEKVFTRLNDQYPHVSEVTEVVLRAFLNSLEQNNVERCTSPEVILNKTADKASAGVQQKSSWWGSWVGGSVSDVPSHSVGSVSSTTDSCVDSSSKSDADGELSEKCEAEEQCSLDQSNNDDLPHDTATFVEWFNAVEQRHWIDTLRLLLMPKLLEPVHRHGDKILEKYVQKRSQSNMKIHSKRQKDKSNTDRIVKEILQKSKTSDDKRRSKHSNEILQYSSSLKKQVLLGSVSFKSYFKEYYDQDSTSAKANPPHDLEEKEASLQYNQFKEVYEELINDYQ